MIRTVCLPGHIQESCATNKDASHAHALKVVEPALKTFEITTVSEASLTPVVLEGYIEKVIVGWITICELVEKNGVEGEGPPICRRRGIGGVRPGRVVLKHGLGICVCVDVVGDEVSAIGDGDGLSSEHGDES